MPIPIPAADETKKQFISRCMGDKYMSSKFKDQAQRYAVCMYSHTHPKRSAAMNDDAEDEFEPCEKCPTPKGCEKAGRCMAKNPAK